MTQRKSLNTVLNAALASAVILAAPSLLAAELTVTVTNLTRGT